MLLNRHKKIRQQDNQQVVKQQPAEKPVVDETEQQPIENVADETVTVPAEKPVARRSRRKKVEADD